MLALATSLGLPPLLAADYHATPAGAGTRDGTTVGNAVAASGIVTFFNTKMKAGDRLLLGPGTYQGTSLSLTQGGTAASPKIIEGPADPATPALFSSSWSIEDPEAGATAVSFGAGVTGVSLKNLRIRGYCFALRASSSPTSPRNALMFENIGIEQVRHGVYFYDCDSLQFTGVRMKRYSKHGFRFEYGCDQVVLRDCVADCSEGDPVWETKTEIFPFGYIVNKGGTPNTGFLFENCVAKNNIKSNQTVSYTNGDGFVIEGNSSDVTFRNCQAIRNQDGGFDLKVRDVKVIGCTAIGHRRDFRIWTTGILENCVAGWSGTAFWGEGGPVTATNCLFLGHTKYGAEMEADKADAPVTLVNSIISTTPGNTTFKPTVGTVVLQGTVTVPIDQLKTDPRYLAAVELGKPAAPTALAVTPGTGLQWQFSGGATRYEILRAITPGGPFAVIGSSSTTSFADTSVTPGVTYYYIVAATNAVGRSVESVPLPSAIPPPIVVPGVVSSMDGGTIRLTFPSQLGRAYRLQCCDTLSDGPWENLGDPVAGTGSPMTLSHPTSGSVCFFRILIE